ncbi:hypothetical protein RHOSPDRAFT_27474 [Rhodotorula sp. JG-1b]|nr:hypothetical protein RHOSPDRAFT_27474 [Rhodotorula sp. JG-1b]
MAQMQPPPPGRGPADLFVLVRPPPSSSRSPLDLQIQLLVPSAARGPPPPPAPRTSSSVSVAQGGGAQNSSSTSFDAIAAASVTGHGGTGEDAGSSSFSRSPSLRSTRSRSSTRSTATTESGYTSATGTSTGTGSGGRRKVTPLLNLEYHTVLPTVVTDAGTDQRVARFLKRGIELTGLAVLDPIDLATAHALAASSVPISPVASNQGSTIASTSASVAAPSSSSTNGGNGNNHGGGFFGRFKRFGANSTTSASSNPAAKVLSSLTAGSSSSSSAEGPSAYALPLLRTRSSHTASPIIHPSRTSLSTPFDPSQPSTATSSDRGYSFQVRKWIRSEFADASPPKSGFRLEWVRAVRRSPSSRRGGGGRAATTAGASRASSLSGRSVEIQAADRVTATGLSRPASDPTSPAVVDEPSSSGGPSHNNDADDRDRADADADDDDEEERAWICTLVYPLSGGFAQQHGYGVGRQSTESTRPPPPSSSASHPTSPTSPPSSSSHLPTTRRMHLATLQPAPHHPKLVSTLLLPPTLPSIPIGSYSPQRGLLGGVLGPEDLRDLAMVTAMWVAVREGLGALEGVVEQMVGSSNTTTTATTTTEGVSGTSPPSSYPAVPTAEPRTSMSSTNARVTTTTTTTLAEAASPPSAKAPPVVVVASSSSSSSPRKSAAPPHNNNNNNNNNKGSISSNRRKGATGIVSGLFGGGSGSSGSARGSSSSSTLGLRESVSSSCILEDNDAARQVCDEEQSKRDLAAKDSSNCTDSNSKQQPSSTAMHAYKSAVVRAAVVTGTVAVVALALTTLCAGGFDRFVASSPDNDGTRVKLDLGERRRVKRAQVDAPTSSSQPKYSSLTTTGEQGEPTTQSFVYTTRPIVNPGGYTIGTLTGYVQITATPTNNATSSFSSLLTEPTPTSTPTSISTETAAQEEPANTDYSRVPWVSRDHETDEDTAPSVPTAGTRLAKRAEIIDDESAPEPTVTEAPSPIATTPSASATDGAEFSTSTDRAGSVYTLVKTTRPIVNPGGFTIGTLDGAWVDVAKQTQAANRKKRAASSPIAVPNNSHDELRRRNVVDFAASA